MDKSKAGDLPKSHQGPRKSNVAQNKGQHGEGLIETDNPKRPIFKLKLHNLEIK